MKVLINKNIKAIIFDVDGVLTDGKCYLSENGSEIKTFSFKDLDAIKELKKDGYYLGIITGEENKVTKKLLENFSVDVEIVGCKEKLLKFKEIQEKERFDVMEMCYIGDGKYDLSVINYAGCGICPNDAIEEVRHSADIVLETEGGQGCLSEVCSLLKSDSILHYRKIRGVGKMQNYENLIQKEINSHTNIANKILNEKYYSDFIQNVAILIVEAYKKGNKVMFCGNGGSAADAQHLSAELVGRFCMERRALASEALNANTSILTAIANDYEYEYVFERQVEANGRDGDILIGITTSGTSGNILRAFKKARTKEIKTVLFTGNIDDEAPIREYSEWILVIPSLEPARIQEMHILIGHILCELVEKEIFDWR